MLLQEHWIGEWWAIASNPDPHDHEGSYKYSLKVSFFEEHVHHVPMEWT